MLQHTVQQERQTCVLLENMQHFIQEISTLRSLTEVAGVAGSLLAELDAFKHEVEYIERLLYNTSSLSFTSSLSQVFIAFSYGLLNVEDLISEGIKLSTRQLVISYYESAFVTLFVTILRRAPNKGRRSSSIAE